MKRPNLEAARAYALKRLKQELSPKLLYHSLAHTQDDVVPAAERLAALEGISGDDLVLLQTAAYYHDIGFVKQREEHESAGIQIASQVLPGFGYSPSQIQTIIGAIQATKIPQSPQTKLEEIMADADLDNLGRDDFFLLSQDLRVELAAFGNPLTTEAWYSLQREFLQAHHYFTASARHLRGNRKQQNLSELETLLDKIHGNIA